MGWTPLFLKKGSGRDTSSSKQKTKWIVGRSTSNASPTATACTPLCALAYSTPSFDTGGRNTLPIYNHGTVYRGSCPSRRNTNTRRGMFGLEGTCDAVSECATNRTSA